MGSHLHEGGFTFLAGLVIKPYSPKNKENLDPWFITGLCDAEGCFGLNIVKSLTTLLGFQIIPRFVIELHAQDIGLLCNFQHFFGGIGTLSHNSKKCRWEVTGIINLQAIINHFLLYPLRSNKWIDFDLWYKSILIILEKGHLTEVGFNKILSFKSALNLGWTPALAMNFPHIVPTPRPELRVNTDPLNSHWLAGFVTGEGSFFFNISLLDVISAWFKIG